MAQINSYPLGTPKSIDLLIGTEMPDPEGPVMNPASKSYTIGSIVALATADTLEPGITDSFFVDYDGVIKEITVTNGLITAIDIVG
jgi:hypothetical protein